MKLEDKVLRILENSRRIFVSGSDIARKLNVSRMAVSKAIMNLRKRGYVIESHPRLGYRYVEVDDLRLLDSYIRDINTKLNFKVLYFEEVSSTQDVAFSLINSGVSEGTIIIAERQTKGRGRLGRKWLSPMGGLWFTIILTPSISPNYVTLLSLMTGCAVALGIQDITNVRPELKWPNDVLINGRKVAGILVEMLAEADRLRYALVGVGINVNNEIPKEVSDSAISLQQVLGRGIPRIPLMRAILRRFDELYQRLVRGDVNSILKVWRSLSSTLGRRVIVYLGEKTIEGIALDVDEDGALIVKVNGEVRKVYSGDVVHLRFRK